MKNAITLGALIAIFSLSYSYGGEKTEETKQEAQEMSHDTKRGVKEAGRDIQEETCELYDSKTECAAKKAGNTVERGTDKVEDTVD